MAGNTTRSEANQSFFTYVKDPITGVIKRIAIPGDVQIGLEGQPSELHLFGRFSVAATSYVIDQNNKGVINVSNDDTVVAVSLAITPITGRIKVHLPTNPRDGQLHFIKDMTGTAGTVPIDVVPSPGLTVDNQAFRTLSDAYGSLALIWLAGQWRMLVAGLGASGGGGSPTNASYITINPESSLSSERHLSGSANITITDHGPKASVTVDLTSILTGAAGTFSYATVGVDQYGRITSISAGATPPSPNAGFLTAGNESGLPNHRQMSGGLGTTVTDSGPGTFFEFNVDPRIVPFLTGATFSGPVNAAGGLTGSLQLTSAGLAYIVGLGTISVVTNSQGQVVISGSLGSAVTSLTSSGGTSVSHVGNNYTVSSSIGADKYAPYLLVSPGNPNDPRARTVVAGSNITFSDSGPGGTFTISSTGGGGGSGSSGVDPWVDVGTSLYTTSSVSIDDQGRSVAMIGDDVFFFVSGTVASPPGTAGRKVAVFGGGAYISGSLIIEEAFSGSHSTLADGITPYLIGQGSVFITTQSNGQIIISGSGGGGGGGGSGAVLSSFLTASLTAITNIPQTPSDVVLTAITSSWTDVAFWFKASGAINGSNTIWYRLLVDGLFYRDIVTYTELANGGAGFGSSFAGVVKGLSPGTHIFAVHANVGGGNIPFIDPTATLTVGSLTYFPNGATMMLMNLTSSGGGGGGGGGGSDTWIDGGLDPFRPGTQIKTTSSVSITDPVQSTYASTIGVDTYFYVSGTVGLPPSDPNRRVNTFGGDTFASGSITAVKGFSGSHVALADGKTPAFLAGSNVTLSTSSLGQVVISSTGGGGGGGGMGYGLYSSRGSPGSAGSGYIATDSVLATWYSDGTVWRPLVDSRISTQVPAAANWSHLAGSSTLVDSNGTLLITPSTGDELWQYTGTLNTSFTAITAISQLWKPGSGDNPACGVFIRNSSVTGGNVGYVRFCIFYNGGALYAQIQQFNGSGTPGSASTVYFVGPAPAQTTRNTWFKMDWDNATGNISCSISNNGIDWLLLDQRAPFQASPTPTFGILPLASNPGENLVRILAMEFS